MSLRRTLYRDKDDDCSVLLEIIWEPGILAECLRKGEISPADISEVYRKSLLMVGKIISDFELERPVQPAGPETKKIE